MQVEASGVVCGVVVILCIVAALIRTYSFLPCSQRRSVLITGCDTGFGRRLAMHLDRRGIRVYAGCLFKDSVEELKDSGSYRLKPLLMDVSDSISVESAYEYVAHDLGNEGLWAVVNNAGIPGPVAPFEWTTKEDCLRTLDVNLLGMYDVILKFLPLIRRGKQGRIVNMASAMGRITFAASPYAISKRAVEALSDGLSYELEPFNVTVHIVEPGAFKTSLLEPSLQMRSIPVCAAQTRQEVKDAYGGDEYLLNFVQQNLKFMQSAASERIDLVLDAYEHALFSRFPKSRYQVGLQAKLIWIPLSLLPRGFQSLFYKLFTRFFGGAPPRPKESVRK